MFVQCSVSSQVCTTASCFYCWILFSMIALLSGNSQPDPYSIHLDCISNNVTARNLGRLTIGASFPIYAELECKNGVFQKNTTEDSAYTVFDFIHGPDQLRQESNNVCIMKQKNPLSDKFSAQLTLYREVQNALLVYLLSRLIVCTYRSYDIVSSNSVRLTRPSIVFEEISGIHVKSRRKLTLYLTDIKGCPLKTDLDLGKKVQLRGEWNNKDSDDFLVDDCWVSNYNNVYQLLHEGCGDGVVFPQNIRFISNYGIVSSPIFEVFQLRGSNRLWFQCTVLLCDGVCPRRLCRLEKLTESSINEAHRKLIFKDGFAHKIRTKRQPYVMQSAVFYVNDPSHLKTLPVKLGKITNNSSVKFSLGYIYVLLAVYLTYYNHLLTTAF